MEQVKERTRDAWSGRALAQMGRELKYALRALRRSPGFLTTSVLVLGVGTGGAIALFTVVNGSLLGALLGVADPGTLVTVERRLATTTDTDFSYPDYRDLATSSSALPGLAAYNGASFELGDASGRRARGSATPPQTSSVCSACVQPPAACMSVRPLPRSRSSATAACERWQTA